MERGWIETIGLLGLDVVLAVTVTLALFDWAIRKAPFGLRRLRAWRRASAKSGSTAPGRAVDEAISSAAVS